MWDPSGDGRFALAVPGRLTPSFRGFRTISHGVTLRMAAPLRGGRRLEITAGAPRSLRYSLSTMTLESSPDECQERAASHTVRARRDIWAQTAFIPARNHCHDCASTIPDKSGARLGAPLSVEPAAAVNRTGIRARQGVAVPIARFRNNPANAARYGERQLGYARKTMTHYAKDSWSRYVTRS